MAARDKATADEAISRLVSLADREDALYLERFFKTGPGEYGEGDRFLGVRVPVTRKVAREFSAMALEEIERLLDSEWHEARLLAIVVMVDAYRRGSPEARQQLFDLYLKKSDRINNWDLVDVSAEHIVGRHLRLGNRSLLDHLARSESLWERRIAIMATFHLIRNGEYEDTFRIADLLLHDPHDLIHKAVGWMLREIGNRDLKAAETFLASRYRRMPRTMLRYAIKRYPEELRQTYLAK